MTDPNEPRTLPTQGGARVGRGRPKGRKDSPGVRRPRLGEYVPENDIPRNPGGPMPRTPETPEEQYHTQRAAQAIVGRAVDPRLAKLMEEGLVTVPSRDPGTLASDQKPQGGKIPIEEEAYAMRLAGYQNYQIADHLQLTHTKRVTETDVAALLATVTHRRQLNAQATMASQFQVAVDRLEYMINKLWPNVEAGNVNSTVVAIKCMERLAAMTGMDAPEMKAHFIMGGQDLDYSNLTLEELRVLKEIMAKAARSPDRTMKDVIDGHIASGGVLNLPKK